MRKMVKRFLSSIADALSIIVLLILMLIDGTGGPSEYGE
jgi:hypothetical protein